jgi:hypothetical protein
MVVVQPPHPRVTQIRLGETLFTMIQKTKQSLPRVMLSSAARKLPKAVAG